MGLIRKKEDTYAEIMRYLRLLMNEDEVQNIDHAADAAIIYIQKLASIRVDEIENKR